MSKDRQPVSHTSHTEMTLDQLGEIQPGLARIMSEVSNRYWILYYAAKGGNWKLAGLQSSEIQKALGIGAVTRPKYTTHLQAFIKGPLAAMSNAINERDWEGFKLAYETGVKAANAYHVVWAHEEISWQLPDEPPKHLKLTS